MPAIGGKDSMSGTFKDLDVPPTLVAFAVNVLDVTKVISAEFKEASSRVIILDCVRDSEGIPDFTALKANFNKIKELNESSKILSAYTIKTGGVAEAVSKMCFGNKMGFEFNHEISLESLFTGNIGSIVLELAKDFDYKTNLKELNYIDLGKTIEAEIIKLGATEILLEEALEAWKKPLEKIFPTKTEEIKDNPIVRLCEEKPKTYSQVKIAKPRVFIPVFPGTNCEYDSQRAFQREGAIVDTKVIRNLTSKDIDESVAAVVKSINNSQIIMFPGGFSAGDEPEGSGKFIAAFFRNPRLSEAIMELLNNRDGLILGICNGFQALIKLGLLPYGEIREIDAKCPTLTYNKIGRHVSKLVHTKVVSTKSIWLSNVAAGDIHTIAVSHGEGRFSADSEALKALMENGQIATQYVDLSGKGTYDVDFNPNGSVFAVEGITSPDGRIFGKMGHSERQGSNVFVNIPGNKNQKIFSAGVNYFG